MIPIDTTIFKTDHRARARKLLMEWPDDPTLPKEFNDLDTRHGLVSGDIQKIMGGGSPTLEIDWLISIRLIEAGLSRQMLPITKADSATVPKFVHHLKHTYTGAFFALTERGRLTKAALRREYGYEQAGAVQTDGGANRSVPAAGDGDKPKANRSKARDHNADGKSSHSGEPAGAELPNGSDAGGGDGAIGTGGVGVSMPTFLTPEPSSMSESGGRLTHTDSTETLPPTSQVTKRKPSTAPRGSANNA